MSSLFSCLIFAFGLSYLQEVELAPLSKSLKPCLQTMKRLDSCIATNLDSIISSLADGWDWLDVPGIDPLDLNEVLHPSYKDGNMSLDLVIKNVIIKGLSKSQVRVVKSKSLVEGKLEVLTKTPSIQAIGYYSSEGILARFPLHSEGNFNISMSDVNIAWIIHMAEVEDAKTKYLKVQHLTLDVMPLQIMMTASQTFDGSNELGQNFNIYLNENSFELYNLVKPKLMTYFSDLFSDFSNLILSEIPKYKILPDLNIEV